MAHHQGMTIVAIADALLDGAMRARFHAEPMVQATELLLQEGTPRDVAVVHPWEADAKSDAMVRQTGAHGGRRLATAHTAAVATHLLSNGRYAVMLTAAGSGYSRWRDWPSRVGARMPPAMTGAPIFSSGTSAAATFGRPATNRSASNPMPMMSSSTRIVPRSPGTTAL